MGYWICYKFVWIYILLFYKIEVVNWISCISNRKIFTYYLMSNNKDNK
jgi:hypothetical protein